jgi:hypothetical protein
MDKNKIRSETRRNSKFSDQVLKSQQTCALSENENILSTKIDNLEGRAGRFSPTETHVNNLKGLRAVFQNMMANINDDNRITRCSYMDFDQAHAMFLSFHPSKTNASLTNHEEKKIFKELLCHPNHGLAVYIVLNKFIVLKSSETDLEHFIEDCLNLKLQDTPDPRLNINKETVHDMIDSMDTAWDKKVMKVVLGVYIL